jgi:ferritin
VWGSHLFRFFKESSDEEREHAEKLMKYQVITSLPCP